MISFLGSFITLEKEISILISVRGKGTQEKAGTHCTGKHYLFSLVSKPHSSSPETLGTLVVSYQEVALYVYRRIRSQEEDITRSVLAISLQNYIL